MSNRLEGKVPKGWGYELIWATNDKYCGKIMVFEKKGAKFSMHFHKASSSPRISKSWLRIAYNP